MRVASYRRMDDSVGVGVVLNNPARPLDILRAIEIYAAVFDRWMPVIADMQDFLDSGLFDVEVLKELMDFVDERNLQEFLIEDGDCRLLAPLERPGAIYALGRNYPAHAKESGADVPDEPIVFAKAPTSVVGPGDNVVYKRWLTRVDPEVELAVVIGKEGVDIPEEQAEQFIAGYTIINDVTARDLQAKDLENSHPWLRSKGIDTFCPMGPWIVTPDEIPSPVALGIELKVNGEKRQKDNTSSMTFDIPFLIHWISRFHTLQPGDVISTGTPEGMRAVEIGDTMECEIESIGKLVNRVVGEEECRYV